MLEPTHAGAYPCWSLPMLEPTHAGAYPCWSLPMLEPTHAGACTARSLYTQEPILAGVYPGFSPQHISALRVTFPTNIIQWCKVGILTEGLVLVDQYS
jgi:hypothetical protein